MFDTGAILHDRYTVERVLARGGMATVYIVRHNTLNTQYALKVLDIPTADIRRRLLQEGRIQASLKHPNIVAVTDAIELDGSPALVMEYVDGPPLSKLIDERDYTTEQAEVWFRQIVSAVSYAHARGLIHRDLKPENVLMAPMTGGYLPKVADFGIAKVVQEYLQDADGPRTQTGIGMGTPAYMPPEQVQSAGSVDHRADVFALGCILYELVCGERAFPGDNLLSILNAIADGEDAFCGGPFDGFAHRRDRRSDVRRQDRFIGVPQCGVDVARTTVQCPVLHFERVGGIPGKVAGGQCRRDRGLIDQ